MPDVSALIENAYQTLVTLFLGIIAWAAKRLFRQQDEMEKRLSKLESDMRVMENHTVYQSKMLEEMRGDIKTLLGQNGCGNYAHRRHDGDER